MVIVYKWEGIYLVGKSRPPERSNTVRNTFSSTRYRTGQANLKWKNIQPESP